MRFETTKDLKREYETMNYFCQKYNLDFKKLDKNDVDFELQKDGKIIGYVEIKGRNKTIKEAYPLPIACRKLVKLCDKKMNPVVIWACYDGLIIGKIEQLEGITKIGGRTPREGSTNDIELMTYYNRSEKFIEIFFKK
jgi:hypothetical protein